MKLINRLLDIIYPPKCLICQAILDSSDQITCGKCDHLLPEYDGAPRSVPMYERSVTPFYYEGPIRDAILRYKFCGVHNYDVQFARWMAIWIRDHLEGRYDLITWAPCSTLRRFGRGFDQSQLLAKQLSKELGCEAIRTLKKVKHNRKQSKTKSAAQRRANVLGVYRAYHPERYIGKRLLVVDDVLTTGATLSECGKVLRMAGAGDLVCAAIASTRLEKN